MAFRCGLASMGLPPTRLAGWCAGCHALPPVDGKRRMVCGAMVDGVVVELMVCAADISTGQEVMARPLSRLAVRFRCTMALPGALAGEFNATISSSHLAELRCASAFGVFGVGRG
jgi:hypothetical protein